MFIEGDLPSVLAIGGEHLSDSSPWWLFRQLSLAVRANGADSIENLRAGWKAFQDSLFVSSAEMAKEGITLIDQGRAAEAQKHLTRYMDENVAVMLEMVRQMLSEARTSIEIAAD